MKSMFKRMLSLLLVLVMVGSMLPTVFAQEAADPNPESVELTDADYASADAIFAKIDKLEAAPATKNATEAELADQAAALVMASEGYVEGSLERNGNSFTWWTEEGVRCIYNPYMREKYANMRAPENPEPAGIYNEPKATKGGWPSGNQVYLIAPYYGMDSSFTDQYKNEAKSIASAIGDTDGYTLYSGTSCTVDKVAEAISNGAVVIFDSHGTTDYDGKYVCEDPDGYEVYDYVSQAKYSYLCLTTKTGVTSADYTDGATYFVDSEGDPCMCINGATIANHMTKDSPSGLLWMAICLGMATDTFATSLRAKGVEVVYGYSQSVTFAGDYCFEETFWDNMIAGKDVATSIATMKSKWGEWDWSEAIASDYGYSGSGYTLSEARKYRSAFPIVVSDEDTHPGQRTANDSSFGADSQQTVKSTYTLYSQYAVTAQSNNTAYGTVSVNGSTITAAPATGYFAQGATVTSGSATVSQDGNTFEVSASSDCTVQINFAPKTAVTVSFSGATVASQNGYAGDVMTLPTAEAPEGFRFVGWMTSPLNADTAEKPSFLTGSFTPTGNTTLYALYSYVDENTTTGTGDYVKVTETPDDWSGEYLIVYESGSLVFNGSLTSLDSANTKAITISDHTISATEGDPYKFIVAPMTGGYSIQSASGKYISGTSGSNTVNANDYAVANTLNIDASGNADIESNTSHLRFNSDATLFRYYKSTSYSSQKAIALYVKDGAKGTTYYTTNPAKCEHLNTVNVAAVAATCTEGGYTAGVQCADCDVFVSGHEPIEALGHSWSSWNVTTAPTCDSAGEQIRTCSVCGQTENQSIDALGHHYSSVVTPPTATEQGYTTYTCQTCGHSYVGDYVEALGQTYTVSFSVPEGVSAVADMLCGKTGITLPEAEAPEGYTFVGWVTALTDATETQPKTYEAGITLTTNANVTLFALYSYVVGGTGSTEYVLTDISEIDADDVFVITMQYTDGTIYALDNTAVSKAPAAPTVTASNGKLTSTPGSNLLWNMGGSANARIFYPDGTTARWLASTNANNGMSVGTGANKTYKVNGGYLQNIGTSRYVGIYLTNPDWRCYTNTTGNIANQTLGFYVKFAGGTTYYTTIGTAQETVAAVYNGSTMQKAYATLDEAIAACGEGQYVKLLSDVEAETILEKDLLLDLNGYALSGILEPDGYQVSCFDSTNKATGSFNCFDIEDQAVVPATLLQLTVNGENSYYMAIAGDNGYSFHYFSFSITHMSLKPAYTAVGYKAVFNGDDAVIAMLSAEQAFGYTLSLENGGSVSRWVAADKLSSGKPVTLRLQNYDVQNYGEAALSAYVSIKIGNTEIKSDVQTITLRSMVETINDTYQQYTQEQLEAVREMINAHEIMKTWNVANILKEEPVGDPVMIQTVEDAYNLAIGERMSAPSTLTGVITGFDTPYDSTYQNVSVVIVVAGAEDKPILCHRLGGEGADQIGVGDTITVTGTLMNYDNGANGIIEFGAGCTIDSWENTGADEDPLTDPVEIIDALYALAPGMVMSYPVTLTGTITEIYTAYDETNQYITVIITVAGADNKPIKCYRLTGTGVADLAVGDVISVTGYLKHYVHSSGDSDFQFIQGCTLSE